ncbi:thermonuclease family protein [Candidatus Hydrogenedentota bacterium]
MTSNIRLITTFFSVMIIATGARADVITARVRSVPTGDRLVLADDEEIRLLGVMTPIPGNDSATTKKNALAAKDHLESLVKGKDLTIMRYPASGQAQSSPRSAYVMTGEVLVNAEMIGAGYAVTLKEKKSHLYAKELERLEELARRNGNGLWATSKVKKTKAVPPVKRPSKKVARKAPTDILYQAPAPPFAPGPPEAPKAPPFKQVADDGTIIYQTSPLPKTPEYDQAPVNLDVVVDVFMDDIVEKFLRDRIRREEARREFPRPRPRP